MTQILMTTLGTVLGVPGTTPIDGRAVFTPWRCDESVARLDDDGVIFPDGVAIEFVDGVPTEPIILAPNDGTWCWRAKIMSDEPSFCLITYFDVPDSATPIPIDELVVVNPCTYQPSPEAAAAWEAAIIAVQNLIATISPGPPGESAYQIAVDNGFVGTEAEWLASLEGPEGPAGPSGLKVYANLDEFLAETTTTNGYIASPAPEANWGVLGVSTLAGPAFTRTHVNTQFSTTRINQTIDIGSSSAITKYTLYRVKSGAGAFGAWRNKPLIPYPELYSDPASMGYVDDQMATLGVTPFADMAALDAYEGDGTFGLLLSSTFDWGGVIGIPAYNGMLIGRAFVRTYRSSDDPTYALLQRIEFTDLTGELVTIKRSRTRTLPAGWSPWSAWTVAA